MGERGPHRREGLTSLIAALPLMALLGLVFVGWLTLGLPGRATMIPEFRGLPLAAAQERAGQRRLTIAVAGKRFSVNHAANTVIEQSPSPGQRATPGSVVEIVLSLGPEMIAVPNLRGRLLDRASALTAHARLGIGRITYVDALAPAGTVLSQKPAPGARVRAGSLVDLVVSRGVPLFFENRDHRDEPRDRRNERDIRPRGHRRSDGKEKAFGGRARIPGAS